MSDDEKAGLKVEIQILRERVAIAEREAKKSPLAATLSAILNLLIGLIYLVVEMLNRADPRHPGGGGLPRP